MSAIKTKQAGPAHHMRRIIDRTKMVSPIVHLSRHLNLIDQLIIYLSYDESVAFLFLDERCNSLDHVLTDQVP